MDEEQVEETKKRVEQCLRIEMGRFARHFTAEEMQMSSKVTANLLLQTLIADSFTIIDRYGRKLTNPRVTEATMEPNDQLLISIQWDVAGTVQEMKMF